MVNAEQHQYTGKQKVVYYNNSNEDLNKFLFFIKDFNFQKEYAFNYIYIWIEKNLKLECSEYLISIMMEPYDEITISKIPERKILINILESEFSNIPSNPKENTGGIPAELILKDLSLDFGFEISIKKGRGKRRLPVFPLSVIRTD